MPATHVQAIRLPGSQAGPQRSSGSVVDRGLLESSKLKPRKILRRLMCDWRRDFSSVSQAGEPRDLGMQRGRGNECQYRIPARQRWHRTGCVGQGRGGLRQHVSRGMRRASCSMASLHSRMPVCTGPPWPWATSRGTGSRASPSIFRAARRRSCASSRIPSPPRQASGSATPAGDKFEPTSSTLPDGGSRGSLTVTWTRERASSGGAAAIEGTGWRRVGSLPRESGAFRAASVGAGISGFPED